MLKLLIFLITPIFATSEICPKGAWDFGKRVAVLKFTCHQNGSGELRFCNRDYILSTGICNHMGQALSCHEENNSWICQENSYFSETRWISEDSISFKFESSFNRGQLEGVRLDFNEK